MLQLYALEGFLDRLARSTSRDRLVLKGGVLLVAFDARRPTRDIDLLALRTPSDAETVRELVAGIVAESVEDGLDFDLADIRAEVMREGGADLQRAISEVARPRRPRWPGDAPRRDFAAEAPRWDEDIPERWPGASAVLVLRSFREEPATGGAGVRRPKYQELNSLLARTAEQLGRGRIGWQILRGHLRPEDLLKGTWDQRPARWLSLSRRLDLRFEGGEHYLAHRQPPNAPWRAIYPYAVTEGPSSFARLLALLGEEFSLVGAVELTMALWTTGGWGLAPGAPESYGWQFALPGRDWPLPASDSLQIATRTTWGKLRAGPDRVAHDLVSDFYGELGLDDEAIPFWDATGEVFRF